jgi:hypothetical protein
LNVNGTAEAGVGLEGLRKTNWSKKEMFVEKAGVAQNEGPKTIFSSRRESDAEVDVTPSADQRTICYSRKEKGVSASDTQCEKSKKIL